MSGHPPPSGCSPGIRTPVQFRPIHVGLIWDFPSLPIISLGSFAKKSGKDLMSLHNSGTPGSELRTSPGFSRRAVPPPDTSSVGPSGMAAATGTALAELVIEVATRLAQVGGAVVPMVKVAALSMMGRSGDPRL
jgi:hypothetical protein